MPNRVVRVAEERETGRGGSSSSIVGGGGGGRVSALERRSVDDVDEAVLGRRVVDEERDFDAESMAAARPDDEVARGSTELGRGDEA